MSYQQINLYQPIFRKQQKIFSAVTMVQGAGVVALGLLLLFGYTRWQSHQFASQYEQLEARRAEAVKRMDQVRAQFPERARNAALAAEVERLRKELDGRQRIAARLDATDAGNLAGFADHLEGLARQRPSNVWLTDVDVRLGGAELVLRGSSLQPEQVPRYLQRLAGETVFAGREFSAFQIEQPEKVQGRYDFVVSTQPLDEKEEKKTP